MACFRLCDSLGHCDTLILTVNIAGKNQIAAPRAIDDTATTRRNIPIDIPILTNDSLRSAAVQSVTMMFKPQFGVATLLQKGQDFVLNYQPRADFCSSTLRDEFYYEVCTAGGCARAFVRVRVLCDGLKIFNGFSPNGDGRNDFFYLDGLESNPNTQVTIYNRWGNRVFTSKDYKNDWGGAWNKGEQVPDGVYFYQVRLENGDVFTGFLEILR